MRFLLILIVLAPATLFAQQEEGVLLKGCVVDAKTRRPVSGAAVRVFDGAAEDRLLESDSEGRFRTADVPPGDYRATAMRSGYEPTMSTAVTVRPDQETHEFEIEVMPTAVIAGRVLDRAGRPVVGVKVEAYHRDVDRRTLQPYWYARSRRSSSAFSFYMGVTDDRGEYRLWGLPRGQYVLQAQPAPLPGPPWEQSLAASPVFYPNSPTFDAAARLRLDWGDRREGIDFRLGPPASTIQSGRIRYGGSPCADCGLFLFQKGSEADVAFPVGRVSADGEVKLRGLPPGEYVVGASKRTRLGPPPTGLLNVVISEDGDRPFTLDLSDAVNVRGRVLLVDPPEEVPEPENPNPVFPQFNVARITPFPRDQSKVFVSCLSEPAEFYGQGNERFFDLLASPGRCRLSVNGPPDSHVLGMSLDGRPLEGPELSIPSGQFSGDLVVRIGFAMGSVSGRVEEPETDTWVFLLPTNNAFARYRSVRVQADGSFSMNVPPGTWQAIAGPGRSAFPTTELNRNGAPRIEVKADETTTLSAPLRLP